MKYDKTDPSQTAIDKKNKTVDDLVTKEVDRKDRVTTRKSSKQNQDVDNVEDQEEEEKDITTNEDGDLEMRKAIKVVHEKTGSVPSEDRVLVKQLRNFRKKTIAKIQADNEQGDKVLWKSLNKQEEAVSELSDKEVNREETRKGRKSTVQNEDKQEKKVEHEKEGKGRRKTEDIPEDEPVGKKRGRRNLKPEDSFQEYTHCIGYNSSFFFLKKVDFAIILVDSSFPFLHHCFGSDRTWIRIHITAVFLRWRQ